MAKSDTNSNDLRQDQPECYSPSETRGLAVNIIILTLSTFDDVGRRPIGRHRTVKANIRSHLDGGPQGWNPHLPSDIVVIADHYLRPTNRTASGSECHARYMENSQLSWTLTRKVITLSTVIEYSSSRPSEFDTGTSSFLPIQPSYSFLFGVFLSRTHAIETSRST